jgi:glycosyltransferase involved in cell wall biosynthesis
MNIVRHVAKSDLVLCWCADLSSLVAALAAKFLRRKSIVIVMGYEVACMPKIGYGRALTPIGKYIVRSTIQLADRALAVSEFSRYEAVRNIGVCPDKLKTVYHGFPVPEERTLPDAKDRIALTVGSVTCNSQKFRRKGQDTFVEAARYLPDVTFILVGDWLDDSVDTLKALACPNVRFVQVGTGGFRLINEYYRRAKIYVQASLHEAFGCSVAEAMLYECVPVVTEAGSLPEVVGDTGFYAPKGQPEALARQIELALQSDRGISARKRIIERFSLENRQRALNEVIRMLIE